MGSVKVFYANSGGIKVRSTAAGSEIATINTGDLMYDWRTSRG